jgi:Flp pilus assembly CpaE family ATPase
MRDELGTVVAPNVPATAPPRILVAIRDPGLERPLLPATRAEHGTGFQIVGRALDVGGLREQVAARQVEAVVVSDDLPGLTTTELRALRDQGLAVLVVPTSSEPLPIAWRELGIREVVRPVDAVSVALTLRGALRERVAPGRWDEQTAAERVAGYGHVLAVVSGKGSPGRTTVALNLAVGLAQLGEEVALVDADLSGGDVGAYLGLDPRANLFTLAHAVQGHRELLDEIVNPELQVWGEDHWLWVLAGVSRAGMAEAITPSFLRALLGYLRRRFAFVVVDLAALPTGPDAIARVVLEEAERILVVGGGDLVAAWHAEVALDALTDEIGGGTDRLGLIINRHDAAGQPPASEIGRAIGWDRDVLATIPYDHRAMRDAQRAQRPLITSRHAVGRALEALARQVRAELDLSVVSDVSAPPPARSRSGWTARLALGRRR